MEPNFECTTCHAIQEKAEGLCRPSPIRDQCQTPTDFARNIGEACDQLLSDATLYCEGCGRPTTQPWSICMPMLITPERPFG